MDMQEMQERLDKQGPAKIEAFNDAVQELCEAAADYIEAEMPASGQGSWGKAMCYNVVMVKLGAVIRLVND